MMIIIGNSVARAFGIAGAASIIRFRTPVEDARDITILFILMGLGMAAGLGALAVAGLGTLFLCAMIPILNVFSSERPRQMLVEIVAEDRDFPTAHVHHVFAVNGIMFEPREVSQGDEATAKYLTTLKPTDSLEDLSAQLMGDGKKGIKNVSWSPPKARRSAAKENAGPRPRRTQGGAARRDRRGASGGWSCRCFAATTFRCSMRWPRRSSAAAKSRRILTKRAKGGKKRLKKLWGALEDMGAVVTRYADPVVKYHAKYLVADESTAIITTLNPTRKCFTRTWDAVLITQDPSVVKGLLTLFKADAAGVPLPSRRPFGRRLIVGPERSRAEIRALIAGAKHSIRILDHKLSDPDLVALLRERRAEGITVIGARQAPDARHRRRTAR